MTKAILDLKTAKDLTTVGFGRAAARYGYYLQSSFYHDGWLAATGEDVPFVFVVAESLPPFDVAVYRPTPEQLELGRKEYRHLLELVKGCRESGQWPGVHLVEQDLYLPPWVAGEEEPLDDVALEDAQNE